MAKKRVEVGKVEAEKKVELRIVSPFLNVKEAAMYLKVSRGTIYQWIHKRFQDFPVRRHGDKPVFLIEELKQWSDRSSVLK